MAGVNGTLADVYRALDGLSMGIMPLSLNLRAHYMPNGYKGLSRLEFYLQVTNDTIIVQAWLQDNGTIVILGPPTGTGPIYNKLAKSEKQIVIWAPIKRNDLGKRDDPNILKILTYFADMLKLDGDPAELTHNPPV